MPEKLVLAYSGGLDTSVAVRWLRQEQGYEVVALTVDVGQERDLSAVKRRAEATGAAKVVVREGKELFVRYFVFPALAAGAVYQGAYPLATALSRPLIANNVRPNALRLCPPLTVSEEEIDRAVEVVDRVVGKYG